MFGDIFLTLIQLIFDMFTLTDNDEVIDQIYNHKQKRNNINKLFLQRNGPTNMTTTFSQYPFSASCGLRPESDFLNDSQVFYKHDHVTILPIHPDSNINKTFVTHCNVYPNRKEENTNMVNELFLKIPVKK